MPHAPLKIEDLRDLIRTGEVADPLVFLESVMNGQDPRRTSALYDLIIEIDDFSDDEISPVDWDMIVEHAIQHSKYRPVSLIESTAAAKTIAEYLHAKRKQIDIGGGPGGGDLAGNPLTEDEIELFKEKFNAEF